tara:strand:- start:241 stop:459 length:219 start_codon:yes stop_codon:yes gene_type:complete
MYNFTRKNNQNQLNTLKPDFIARRGGVSFFECPIGGDESPMLAKDTGGIWFDTNIWEIEDAAEEIQWLKSKA